MLTVILKILSILGILLLVLLGILLTVVLLVLFVPVIYRVRADRQETVPEGDSAVSEQMVPPPLIHIAVKADWLLGFLRVRFQYPEPGTVRVKLLFFTLFDSGAEADETTEQPKRTTKTREKKAAKESAAAKGKTETENKTAARRTEAESAEEQTTEKQSADSTHRKEESESCEKKNPKQSPLEKIRYTFQNLCAKIKVLWENFAYYKEVLLCEDTKGLTHHALMRLGRILKSIRPRKLRADIRFGTGSPDTTGYVFGIYCMLCSWLGKQVVLTPDFERAVLVGELDAAGHITVFKLLWHGLFLITDRRLRKLMDKLQRT